MRALEMTILDLPDEQLQVQIRAALDENVETRDRDLDIIKLWLKQQPHLPDTWDDQLLLSFLRGCNFRLEKCKKKLDMYFSMKNAAPEFFAERDLSANKRVLKVIDYADAGVLPRLTPDGKRVTVLRGLNEKLGDMPDLTSGMKLMLMVGDLRMLLEKTGVAGDVYILDASVATAKNFATISPGAVKKFLICIQEAYPVKLKQVHVINVNSFVQTIFTWVRPFLKDKIRDRVHFHSKLDTLYEYVPKSILPKEYGGDGGPIRDITDAWVAKLHEYQPWFIEQEKYRTDESKRPGKTVNYDELFGIEGTFKKLSID